MDSKPVNLSVVMKEFNAWDEYATGVVQENKFLEHEVEVTKREAEEAKERENYLLNELKYTRDLVSVMQATLTKRCDLQDENIHLHQNIKTMNDQIDALAKENEEKLIEMQMTIDKLKKSQAEQMDEMKSSLLHSASEEKATLKKTIDEQTSEVGRLNNQLVNKDKQKQSELMKLRLEFDSKLLMSQKQTAKIQQTTSQMSSSNHDIFRKKLQHVKLETDREISSLKRTISELQGKLDCQAQRSTTSNPSALSLAKRKLY